MRALSWTAPSSIPPQPPRSSPTAAVWPLGGRRCPRRPCRRCCSTGVGIAAPAHQHGPGPAHCHPQCHRHGHRRTLCATLRGQRHCAACGRALRARAGVAGMQRGAWRTVGGSRGRAECGQADRGGRACVWAQCGWVGRGAAGPAREGGCGRENEPLGTVGSFRGPGPPGRPPDMTPITGRHEERWYLGRRGVTSASSGSFSARPGHILRESRQSSPSPRRFAPGDAAPRGLGVATTPTARRTAPGSPTRDTANALTTPVFRVRRRNGPPAAAGNRVTETHARRRDHKKPASGQP